MVGRATQAGTLRRRRQKFEGRPGTYGALRSQMTRRARPPGRCAGGTHSKAPVTSSGGVSPFATNSAGMVHRMGWRRDIGAQGQRSMRPVKRVRVQPRLGPSYIAGNPQRRRYARAANRGGPSAWMRSASARVTELVHHSRARSVRSASGYQPKLDIAEQCKLNFGRHRSGLSMVWTISSAFTTRMEPCSTLSLRERFPGIPGGLGRTARPGSASFDDVPPGLPDWFHPEQSHEKLFGSELWDASRPHCLGLMRSPIITVSFSRSALASPSTPSSCRPRRRGGDGLGGDPETVIGRLCKRAAGEKPPRDLSVAGVNFQKGIP